MTKKSVIKDWQYVTHEDATKLPTPPGFRRTGEHRKPRKGEWFIVQSHMMDGEELDIGQAYQARVDYLNCTRQIIEPEAPTAGVPAGETK